MASLHIDLLFPTLLILISYFFLHFDPSATAFFMAIAAGWLGMWMATSYGYLLSAALDTEVALAVMYLMLTPFILLGGYYALSQSLPSFYRIFEYMSAFKYVYQAVIYSQFYNRR